MVYFLVYNTKKIPYHINLNKLELEYFLNHF